MSDALVRELPQNVEAEQAVLGAMLVDENVSMEMSGRLRAEMFTREAHRVIFRTMQMLAAKSQAIDLITLSEALNQAGDLEKVGGPTYLATLGTVVPSTANVEEYAAIVQEKALLRDLIAASQQTIEEGFKQSDDVERILDRAESRIFELAEKREVRGFVSLGSVLQETYTNLSHLVENRGSVTGIPTGFTGLDEMTSGFQPSDLIVLAARPSVGKTAFVLNIAQNIAIRGHVGVGLFSLEMARSQLALRILSSETGIESQLLRTGYFRDKDWLLLGETIAQLAEAPIYIDDTPGISIMEMRSKARRLKAEHDIGLIMVDYLQLMQGSGRTESRQQEVAEITRALKALARELNVPVIAISQLSRAAEQRNDKRPNLSDLRESGEIEQAADLVMLLYREDYYDKETEKKNQIEVIVAKHRNGPVGDVSLVFLKNIGKFANMSLRTDAEAG
jgi:replicative DNA helicase